MKAICEGTYPSGYRGISKKVACEYISGQSPKDLPYKKSYVRKKVKEVAKRK